PIDAQELRPCLQPRVGNDDHADLAFLVGGGELALRLVLGVHARHEEERQGQKVAAKRERRGQDEGRQTPGMPRCCHCLSSGGGRPVSRCGSSRNRGFKSLPLSQATPSTKPQRSTSRARKTRMTRVRAVSTERMKYSFPRAADARPQGISAM